MRLDVISFWLVPTLLTFAWWLPEKLYGLVGWERLPLGVSSTLFSTLFLVNLGLRLGLPWNGSLIVCGAIHLLLIAALWKTQAPEPETSEISWLEASLLLGFCLMVVMVTNAGQLHSPDDDYWLHTPLQAHLKDGSFPPLNPFFSNLELKGHYGRDLLIVIGAKVLDLNLTRSQWWLTTTCQTLTALLLFALFKGYGRHPYSAWLALLFAFLGVGVGYKAGLLDLYQNNSGPLHLGFFLLVTLFFRWLEKPTLARAILLSLTLATYAFVYETHFGLFLIACLPLVAHQRVRLSQLTPAFLPALLLALVHGGVFTDLAQRSLNPAPTDSSLLNQSQRASLTFPKPQFLQLRMAQGELQPISCAYKVWPGRLAFRHLDHQPRRQDPVYVSIFSWYVLRMHWLPLVLSPLSLWVAIESRDRLGLFFWLFGAAAFLVPGLVHFGPIHEWEYFRWEFACGLGLALALSQALAQIASESRLATATTMLLVALTVSPGLAQLGQASTQISSLGPLRTASLGLSYPEWLRRHRQSLYLQPGDVEALGRLKPLVTPGQTVLVNFEPDQPWSILFESTLAGVTGLYPVGHQLPRPEDPVGLPPHRMSQQAQDFLEKPETQTLKALDFDWLYLRRNRLASETIAAFSNLPELELRVQVERPGAQVLIFKRKKTRVD